MSDVSAVERPRGRGLRLRALMILILPLGLGMAYVVNYPRAIRRAVAAVESAGGDVRFGHQYQMDASLGCLVGTTALEPPGPRWLRRLIGDEWFSDVVFVAYYPNSPKSATDEVLATVSTFRRLQILSLTGGRITDGGLEHLQGLDRLEYLDLHETPIGDRGLATLAGLKGLKHLDLTKTQVTSAGLKQLVGLDKLAELHLNETRVDDEGISALARMENLALLNLGKTCVSAPGLAHLSPLKLLKALYVSPENLEAALVLKRQITGLDVSASD